MKVLNVSMRLDAIKGGGGAERTFQMSRFLLKTGIKCTVLTMDLDLTPERVAAVGYGNVVALPCLNERFYFPRISPGILQQIKRIVKDVDIIHIMCHWTFINVIVYFFARQFRKPYVVCPAGSLAIFGRSGFLKKTYNLLVGRRILQNASWCIAVAKNEMKDFQAYGIDTRRVTIIPNGIDINDFLVKDDKMFRNKHGLSSNPFILFIGRLNMIKGPDLLLQAFTEVKDRFPEYHLVFAGPDEGMLCGLKEFCEKHDIAGRVHFVGHVDKTDKSLALHAADILAVPSRREAMSIVAVEAGATGTPVLITDQCGFDEISAVNWGIVVEASVRGLSYGLNKLLSNNPELKVMGENLRDYTVDNFTWDALVHRYMNLYYSLLESRHKPGN